MRTGLCLLTATLATLAVFQYADAASCNITEYDDEDIKNAQSSCNRIVINGIQVPAGKTLDLTYLQTGTIVIFQGIITWAYKEWEGPLISVAGTNIQIVGAPGHVLDGRGSLWWDGKGGNDDKKKPNFFKVKMINSQIFSLHIKDTPVHGFSISNCDGVLINNITIDNSAGDTLGGHNTDAFDVNNSNNITIQSCIVKNQDDCLAINSGTDIKFLYNNCSGGHGISIGSIGGRDNNIVKGVNVSDCVVTNSNNGIRIKTISGATGSVSNVTFQRIILSNIHKFGIVIQGDYQNDRPTGTPTGGVPITDLTVKNIKGTVDSEAVVQYILVKNCSNWHFSEIMVTGSKNKNVCVGVPPDAGVEC